MDVSRVDVKATSLKSGLERYRQRYRSLLEQSLTYALLFYCTHVQKAISSIVQFYGVPWALTFNAHQSTTQESVHSKNATDSLRLQSINNRDPANIDG